MSALQLCLLKVWFISNKTYWHALRCSKLIIQLISPIQVGLTVGFLLEEPNKSWIHSCLSDPSLVGHQVQVGTHKASKWDAELKSEPVDGASGGVNVPLLPLLGDEPILKCLLCNLFLKLALKVPLSTGPPRGAPACSVCGTVVLCRWLVNRRSAEVTFTQKMGLPFLCERLTVVPSGFEIWEVPAFGKSLQEWKSSPSAWTRLLKLQHWLENRARWDLPLALANV